MENKILATVNASTSIANKITKNCTNFEENVVVLSQCINTGTLQCGKESIVGGFVGQLNEYSVISECLNTGAIVDANDRNAAQLTPEIKIESIVEDCVLAGGKSWNYIDIVSINSSAEVSGIYYWTDGYTPSTSNTYSIPVIFIIDNTLMNLACSFGTSPAKLCEIGRTHLGELFASRTILNLLSINTTSTPATHLPPCL